MPYTTREELNDLRGGLGWKVDDYVTIQIIESLFGEFTRAGITMPPTKFIETMAPIFSATVALGGPVSVMLALDPEVSRHFHAKHRQGLARYETGRAVAAASGLGFVPFLAVATTAASAASQAGGGAAAAPKSGIAAIFGKLGGAFSPIASLFGGKGPTKEEKMAEAAKYSAPIVKKTLGSLSNLMATLEARGVPMPGTVPKDFWYPMFSRAVELAGGHRKGPKTYAKAAEWIENLSNALARQLGSIPGPGASPVTPSSGSVDDIRRRVLATRPKMNVGIMVGLGLGVLALAVLAFKK